MSTIKSFSDLKNKASVLQTLQKDIQQKTQKNKGNKDARFWQPAVDKTGSGSAVIRFLPPTEGDELAYVQLLSHGFQGPNGKWFIENCPNTIGLPCPVCEGNKALWDSKDEASIEVARKRKKRTKYVSNIYVVKDPANPENEGKVFLYEYGAKIFDKLKSALAPEFPDEEAINIFDFWEGANFKLRISQVAGYRNYDKSGFDVKSKLLDDDAQLENIWKQQYKLSEFTNPANFKSYTELKKRYDEVTGSMLYTGTTASLEEQLGKTVFESTGNPLLGDIPDDDLAELLNVSLDESLKSVVSETSGATDEDDELRKLLG